MRIGSLASHLGLLDDYFEEFLSAGKLSKVRSWYNNMGLIVQTNRDAEITWIVIYEACAPLKWSRLTRDHIIGKKTRPAWVCRPNFGWVDISSGDKKRLDKRYQSGEILVKRLSAWTASEEVLKIM